MTSLPIAELFAYDRWATEQVLADVVSLSAEEFTREPAGELSSIRQQCVHLASVPDRYRARLMGEPAPEVSPESFAEPQDLIAYHGEVADRVESFIASLDPTRLDDEVRHETRRGLFVATVLQTLLHVVNHSTYHRGQIAALLKVMGREPVDTDLVIWVKVRG